MASESPGGARGQVRWRGVRGLRGPLLGWVLVGALALLLAGPWYGGALRTGGASTLATIGERQDERPPVTLAGFVRHYDYARYGNALFKGYWLYAALRWLCALTLLGLAVAGMRSAECGMRNRDEEVSLARRQDPRDSAFRIPHSAFVLVAAVAHLVTYVAIEYRIASVLRSITVLQGRYYLPGIAAQMLLALLAWEAFVPRRWRALAGLPGLALAAAMIAFNWYALFGVLAPRYVGADPAAPLGIPWDRLTILAPGFDRPPLLIALFLLTLAAQAAWLLVAVTEVEGVKV